MRNKNFKKTTITFDELADLFKTTVKEYCPDWPNITTFTTGNDIKCVEIAPHSSDDENSPIILRYNPQIHDFDVTSTYTIIKIHGNITNLTDTVLDDCIVADIDKLDVGTIIHVYDAITKYMMFGDFRHRDTTLTRDDLIVPKYRYTFNTDIIKPGNAYQIIYKDPTNGDESVQNVICIRIDETHTSIECNGYGIFRELLLTEEDIISGKVTFTKSLDNGDITNDDVLVRHDTREASFNTNILEYGAVYAVTHNDDEFTAILTHTSNYMLQFMITSTCTSNFYMDIDCLIDDPDVVFTLRKLE